MSLPQGNYPKGDTRVRKLLKSLYGLKQSLGKQNEKLFSSLFSFRFQQCVCDYSIFVRTKSDHVVILLIYIDDIILTGNIKDDTNKFKNF